MRLSLFCCGEGENISARSRSPNFPRYDMIENTKRIVLELQTVGNQANIEVTFYTKAGCHLCEEARELLEEQAEQTEYTLTEVDIRSDLVVFELYRYRIPVILINQETLLEGRIDAQELANAFRQAEGE